MNASDRTSLILSRNECTRLAAVNRERAKEATDQERRSFWEAAAERAELAALQYQERINAIDSSLMRDD